jgi:CpeT protein
MKKIILLLVSIAFFACKEKEPEIKEVQVIDEDLQQVNTFMTGSFDNSRQAATDTIYTEVTLHMYPIWIDTKDYWLYVEQAFSDNQEKPYRQRIYKLSRENDSVLKSEIYTLPNASLWKNKWETPEQFDKLLIDSIVLIEGCEVFLKKTGEGTYKGKTKDKNCLNDLNGASYAISEVEIGEKSITAWDRGFSEKDSLVWGPEKGGYIFNKIED